jgi:hypothetical protein
MINVSRTVIDSGRPVSPGTSPAALTHGYARLGGLVDRLRDERRIAGAGEREAGWVARAWCGYPG